MDDKELRELRRIRQQIQRNNTNKRLPSNAGNGIIKAILIGGLVILVIFMILLTMIMY